MPSITAVDCSYNIVHDHALIAAASDSSANSYLNVVDGLQDTTGLTLSNPYIISSPGGLFANDSTTGSGTLTLAGINGADGNALTFSSGCTVAVASDGSFLFVAAPGIVSTESFTYTVTDGTDSASATVTINVTDTAPVASDATISAVHDQVLPSINLTQYATDADGDPLAASIVSGPSNGQLMQNPDGTYDYLPNSQHVGADSFTYKVNDGIDNSNTATVSINVTDQAPVANDETFGVPAHGPITIAPALGVLAYDTDADGDALTASLVSNPSNGAVNFNSDGSFTYTPNARFTGTDSFTYQASDGILASNAATITLNVHSTNQAPVAADDSYTVSHNTPLTISASLTTGVLANDTDADNDPLTASLISNPSNGTVALNSDGSFAYTPNNDFIGTDTFTYVANDSVAKSNIATVSITVTDNAPSAGDWSFTVEHGQTLTVSSTVLSESTDVDGDPLTAVLVSGPSDGHLHFDADGTFTYSPNSGFAGTDTFSYEANDGMENSDVAVVYVFAIDNAPMVTAPSYSTPTGQTLTVAASSGVLANASDLDGDPLTAQLASDPANGSVTVDSAGSFTYTPNAGFTGADTFGFNVSDGVTVTLCQATVSVGSTPYPVSDFYNVQAGKTLSVLPSIGGVDQRRDLWLHGVRGPNDRPCERKRDPVSQRVLYLHSKCRIYRNRLLHIPIDHWIHELRPFCHGDHLRE